MISLLDVNFLIALGDSNHVHADAALQFFANEACRSGWATCPLTENAFLRIFGHPNYPSGSKSTSDARRVLLSIRANPGHQFWPDEISLLDEKMFPTLPASKDLTDVYLLALAVKHQAQLVTFDQRIDPTIITGGTSAYRIVRPNTPDTI